MPFLRALVVCPALAVSMFMIFLLVNIAQRGWKETWRELKWTEAGRICLIAVACALIILIGALLSILG